MRGTEEKRKKMSDFYVCSLRELLEGPTDSHKRQGSPDLHLARRTLEGDIFQERELFGGYKRLD